jgi:hypothetical protein
MSKFIRVVNGVLPQPYLVLPKKLLYEVLDWLQANGVGYKVMEETKSTTDVWFDVDLPPKGMEPIIDAWIEARGLTHQKWRHPASSRQFPSSPRDPFQVFWEFQSAS